MSVVEQSFNDRFKDKDESSAKNQLIMVKKVAQAIYMKRYEIARMLVEEMNFPSSGWGD
jgi:hypothetical protein